MCDHMDMQASHVGVEGYWEGDEYLCKDIYFCACPDCESTFLVDDSYDLG